VLKENQWELLRMNYDQEQAKELTKRIMANPNSANANFLENDLLKQFHRGYPLENLRPLLHDQGQDIVGLGAWIASELGEMGRPLIDDIAPLLNHHAKKARFFAIDCILLWAGPSKKLELASAAKLVNDPEPAVRWKAMDFLSRATREQLLAALSHMETTEPTSANATGLRWLLGPEATYQKTVIEALQLKNDVLRKYAGVAAARISKNQKDALKFAASVDDLDVKSFAESSLALLNERL
jgi:hypothetical protein